MSAGNLPDSEAASFAVSCLTTGTDLPQSSFSIYPAPAMLTPALCFPGPILGSYSVLSLILDLRQQRVVGWAPILCDLVKRLHVSKPVFLLL